MAIFWMALVIILTSGALSSQHLIVLLLIDPVLALTFSYYMLNSDIRYSGEMHLIGSK